ncbi:MAG: hypothetical protein RL321_908 [Pseudomonadota bacterium]
MSHKSSPDSHNGTQQSELGLRGRLAFTVAWCSFLAASVATLVFFAFVDPAPIVAVLQPTGALQSRTALYSLGFFFFWIVSAVSAGLTASLLCTPPSSAPKS